MNAIIYLVLVGSACNAVFGQTPSPVGQFSPVDDSDKPLVDACKAKVTTDLQTQEAAATNGAYTAIATLQDVVATKQVVSGTNIKLEFKCAMTYACVQAGCPAKNAVTRTCTATVYKSLNANDALTYVTGQEPKCSAVA